MEFGGFDGRELALHHTYCELAHLEEKVIGWLVVIDSGHSWCTSALFETGAVFAVEPGFCSWGVANLGWYCFDDTG